MLRAGDAPTIQLESRTVCLALLCGSRTSKARCEGKAVPPKLVTEAVSAVQS